MKKRLLFLQIVLVISSCSGKKQDLSSDRLSNSALLLFNHTNPKLSDLAREKCASGCEKYLLFADALYKSSGSLIEQSGGLNENGEVLVPYRKGRLALEILENNNVYSIAEEIVNSGDSLALVNMIQYSFFQEQGIYSKEKVIEAPFLPLTIELLILENEVYTQILNKN